MTQFKKIGIIGMGLIGGSIAKALEGKASLVFDEAIWSDIKNLDAVILAVPISAILEIGERIASLKLDRPLAVLDVGSVKEPIALRFEEWTQSPIEFVATHPMAGKEKGGIEHSDKDLFQKAPWVITPHAKNTKAVLSKTEDLISSLGAFPLFMDAATHDKRAALISQLPYLLSKALLEFVRKTDPASLEMAGPGFHSMTRLADDNPSMRKEISRYNRENIDRCLQQFKDSL